MTRIEPPAKGVNNWHVWQKMLLCAVILFVPTALTVLGAMCTVFHLMPGKVGVVFLIVGIVSLVAGGYYTLVLVRDISKHLRQLAGEAQEIADGRKQTLSMVGRRDEIGELSEAFRRVVETSRRDRERLQQNNNDLHAVNAQLEDANKQVQSFAYKAGEANNAKREFLAVMSHEIRTPVNGIIGMTELAMQTNLTSGQREYLQTINSCAESLLAQLNDVLDFSKIEAGKLELERTEFSLRELLGEALSTLAARAHTKGIELLLHIRPEVPDTLIGDPHRLRQIVVNLVGNALKFTDKGDVLVRVENSRWVEGEAELAFAIADTGIGIPADRLATIFQPFSQADYSTTRRFGGTGLGLAITQQLVGLMGGAVKVESEVNRGSVFRFTARFGYQKPSAPEQDFTSEQFRHRRVMVLEPHSTSMRIITELLGAWQIKAEQVRDEPTAVAQLQTAAAEGKPFQVFIGDAAGVESLGSKVASTVSNSPALRATRVILLVTAPNRHDPESFGVATRATIAKPVTSRTLKGALNKALESDKKTSKMLVPKSGKVPAQRPLHVLVAEDNAVNQRLAKLNLEGWGHQVTVANDGQEAVEQYEQVEFDLVLMDLQMPRLSGFEASAEIRKRETTNKRKRLPILALSANVLKGVRDECAKSGMDGYVSKPVRQQELLRAMSSVLPALFHDAGAAALYLESGDPKTIQPAGASSALFHPAKEPAVPVPVAVPASAVSGVTKPSPNPAPPGAVAARESSPLESSRMEVSPITASSAAASPAAPSTFDAEMLMENLGGDKALLGEVVTLCRNEDAPRLLKQLADSLAMGDCPAAAKAAHGLKGMVGAFNATTAWSLAKHLEISAKEDRLEILLADADEFVRALRALVEDLERFAGIDHQHIEWV